VSLERIAGKARQVDEIVAEIATASQEQTKGRGQVHENSRAGRRIHDRAR
jgi:methyl-accepting chemotaxis protein